MLRRSKLNETTQTQDSVRAFFFKFTDPSQYIYGVGSEVARRRLFACVQFLTSSHCKTRYGLYNRKSGEEEKLVFSQTSEFWVKCTATFEIRNTCIHWQPRGSYTCNCNMVGLHVCILYYSAFAVARSQKRLKMSCFNIRSCPFFCLINSTFKPKCLLNLAIVCHDVVTVSCCCTVS